MNDLKDIAYLPIEKIAKYLKAKQEIAVADFEQRMQYQKYLKEMREKYDEPPRSA